MMFAKNRDRSYTPKISFHHELIDGVEVLYYKDNDTGWIEGINEYGIGVINSALMVGHDEQEKKIVKKTGKPSKDAPNIKKILSKKNMKEVLDMFEDYPETIVKGHTFIGSAKEGIAKRIEVTSKHEFTVKPLNLDELTVRTNHGFEYPDAGYETGIDYKSSLYRKSQAEKFLNRSMSAEQIMNTMKKKNYSHKSSLNMNRDTSNMITTGQIVLDLTNNTLYYNSLNGKSEVLEYVVSLPKGHKEKLDLVLIKDEKDEIKKIVKENKMIILKPGQKILTEDGEILETEEGDVVASLSEAENNIVKDFIDTKWSEDEDKGKAVAMFKGLMFSDDPKVQKFVKALDAATSKMKVEDFS